MGRMVVDIDIAFVVSCSNNTLLHTATWTHFGYHFKV